MTTQKLMWLMASLSSGAMVYAMFIGDTATVLMFLSAVLIFTVSARS